jgi:hypothetical protein
MRPRHPNILVPAKPLAVRMRNRFRNALKAAENELGDVDVVAEMIAFIRTAGRGINLTHLPQQTRNAA